MSARILILTGTVHPKAELQAIDAANGIATFRWLDAAGNPVDSGGSVAKFAPLAPNEPENEGEPITYPEVPDATLIDAIENPPAPELGRWRVLKDTAWMRIKEAGLQAGAVAFITSLPTSQRLDWDSQSWFWSDNAALGAICMELGADPAEILAPDPLAP